MGGLYKVRAPKLHRSIVFLAGFDENGKLVFREDLSYDDYYEGSHPVIDDNDYRAQHGIRRITGRVFDLAGNVQQDFESHYNEKGEVVSGRIVHQDGTVNEFA